MSLGVGHGSLHVAYPGCSLGEVDGRTVKGKRGGAAFCFKRLLIAVQECIDSIDAVDGRIPSLSTLLLQQPTAHLVHRLAVGRGYQLDGFQSSHLGGYLVVVPRIAGTWGIIVAAHLFRKHRKFFQALNILLGQF